MNYVMNEKHDFKSVDHSPNSNAKDFDYKRMTSTAFYKLFGLTNDNASINSTGVFQEYPYMLQLTLHSGVSLAARDSNGKSDPFVKFKMGGRSLGKSKVIYKTLNPKWEEQFEFDIVGDFEDPLEIKVYDKDRLKKNYMGGAKLDLTQLVLWEPTRIELQLEDETGKAKEPYLGAVHLTCVLIHRNLSQENSQNSTIEKEIRTSATSLPMSDKLESVSSNGSENVDHSFAKPSQSTKPLKSTSILARRLLSSSSFQSRPAFLAQHFHRATVFVCVVEASGLIPMDDNGLSDPFIKFRMLNNQKYKTKVCKETLTPRWLEYFEFKLFSDVDANLELTVWDYDVAGRNDFMGRAAVDLKKLEHEKTHVIHQQLEDHAGQVTMLITISDASDNSCCTDLNFSQQSRQEIIDRYKLNRTGEDLNNVGWCRIKVLRGQSLPRDAHMVCVLEITNTRLQTHVVANSQGSPKWNKAFEFNVNDIHDSLEISLVDQKGTRRRERRTGNAFADDTFSIGESSAVANGELLGRISLPLLRLRNGEQRWYALKDKNLQHRKPGALLLEADVIYNPIRAAIRTLNPKERRFMKTEPKFKIHTMRHNVDRFIHLVEGLIHFGNFVNSLWAWTNPFHSALGFIVYLIAVWNFELYMLPLTLVVLLLANRLYHALDSYFIREHRSEINSLPTNLNDDGSEKSVFGVDDTLFDSETEDSDPGGDKEESNGGLIERIRQVQTYLLLVQQHLHSISSTLERIRNTFRWSVPWLSSFCVLLLLLATIVLYVLPLRWLLLLWGSNKFTKNLLRPHVLDNNELADFLSRVPSDDELSKTKDLKPLIINSDKR